MKDTQCEAKFSLGSLYITPGAMKELTQHEILTALSRHVKGDWGDLGPEDIEENEFSVKNGYRLLSSYKAESGTKFWVITEWDRSATTVLLPMEY